MKNSKIHLGFGLALVAFVVAILWAGFVAIGPPELRGKAKRDLQRSEDLLDIRRSIYTQTNGSRSMKDWKPVPKSLDDVESSGWARDRNRVDPLTNQPYEYRPINDTSYEICITFELDHKEMVRYSERSYFDSSFEKHKPGRQCFTYKINQNPTKY